MNLQIPTTMAGVQLTAHGGPETLVYRTDIPTPEPADGEVLIQVGAAGVNNTDINTRIGWYSKTVTGATDDAQGSDGVDDDGGWSNTPLGFPRIQGADCCGTVVAVGAGVPESRVGERVLVRSMMRDPDDARAFRCRTFGSECDGGFAQFATVPSVEAHAVNSSWSDVELASIPCAYSTAENMLHRIGLGAERVLITGASGGVGSAAVQLSKRRGADVIAVSGAAKADGVAELGADLVVDRNADLVAAVGRDSVDVVVDLVAGPSWPSLLDVLVNGGRYVTAGAIAGPIVELDVRTLYLRDLTLMGATFQDDVVFENLVGYIERDEIRPVVAATYPLAEIGAAQEAFLAKGFIGKLVLVPPPVNAGG